MVPAAAQRPVRLHDDVPDLPREPVRAPEQLAVDDDAAADARPGSHEQHVAEARGRAQPVLAPGGGVRVVVGQRRAGRARPTGAGRAARCARPGSGANVSRPVSFSTRPAAPTPIARTSGAITARATSTIVSSVACMSFAGVGQRLAGEHRALDRHADRRGLRAADVEPDRLCPAARHPVVVGSSTRAKKISRWSPAKFASRTTIRFSVCGRIRFRLYDPTRTKSSSLRRWMSMSSRETNGSRIEST